MEREHNDRVGAANRVNPTCAAVVAMIARSSQRSRHCRGGDHRPAAGAAKR